MSALRNARSLLSTSPYAYRRLFSAVSASAPATGAELEPVDLDYTVQVPPDGNTTEGPLVILHGLFGSKRNWNSLTKAFVRDLGRPVYALDLRNQGNSLHVAPMTYTAMAVDVLHFLKKHKLENVSLLGHSMGGKVAMSVALRVASHLPDPKSTLSNLVISDITPSRTALSEDFVQYIDIMSKIEQMALKTRAEAGKVLEEYEKDSSIRQFLLTNLVVPPLSSPDTVKFQIPVALIRESIAALGSFPYEPGESRWTGRTLVVKGNKSKYINKHNLRTLEEFFPHMQLETLEAGHWVHAEKPHAFKKLVVDFIQVNDKQ
ncbi:hypothetical protein AX17_005518 [Amanita inopinata Kibby_2008]|nr:hypothetical protein AX17_005518 [Amanita inopinata Kibby_2008]